MHDLTIIRQNGDAYIDSREAAEAIGKDHNHLLRDIRGYIKVISQSGASNFGHSDFFIESSYQSAQNKEMPCYLITRKGCDVIANKLTGDKGILFTVAYVTRFHELEAAERAELEALIALSQKPEPRLGEINACARIIVRGLKNFGASPERIMEFLKETYEPFGITVTIDFDDFEDEEVPRWYTAGEIARECGIYSLSGRPHGQAVSCILNENLFISAEHKRVAVENYGDFSGVSVRYDDFALCEVLQWLVDYELPDEIYGFERTYYVQYLLE